MLDRYIIGSKIDDKLGTRIPQRKFFDPSETCGPNMFVSGVLAPPAAFLAQLLS